MIQKSQPMRFSWACVATAMAVAAAVNIAIYYLIGPIAAVVEAIPGGLIIGALFHLLWPRPKARADA